VNYAAVDGSPQSFTVLRATTTISINNLPSSPIFGGNFTPTYAYTGDGTPSVTSSTLGKCTVSSGVVSFVGAGTCTLVAHATAGVNYAAVDGSPQSFTVLRATTTISINNIPGSTTLGGNFTPTYAYTGDGSPSTTSSTPSKCTVSGGVVTFAGAGTCTLVAHATAGVNFAAVDGTPQSFTIAESSVDTQRQLLINQVQSMQFSKGRETSLLAKLKVPPALTCDRVQNFINEVNAQTNKDITATQAQQLKVAAFSLGSSMGCALQP